MSAEDVDAETDARLDALTRVLSEGVFLPSASTQAAREAELRSLVARHTVRRARGRAWRMAGWAVGLLAAFVVGRLSWRVGADPSPPSAKLLPKAWVSPESPARAATAVQDRVSRPEPALRVPAPEDLPAERPQKAPRRTHPQPKPPASTRARPEIALGFSLLREGRLDEAATAFARVAQTGPSSIRGDATYFEGVCLARAGRRADAIKTFRRFVSKHPGHEQVDAARVALGWLLLRSRQPEEAYDAFESARDAPDPSLSTSARKGLEIISIDGSHLGARASKDPIGHPLREE